MASSPAAPTPSGMGTGTSAGLAAAYDKGRRIPLARPGQRRGRRGRVWPTAIIRRADLLNFIVCLWPGRVLEPVPRARRRDDQPGKRLLDHETSVGGDGVHARNRPDRARRDAPQTSFDVSFVKFVRPIRRADRPRQRSCRRRTAPSPSSSTPRRVGTGIRRSNPGRHSRDAI